MNIVLTGLRGSGKSKLGKLIAEKLKREFIDTDSVIEIESKKTIAQIVKENGWDYFRKLERKAVEKISKLKNKIIATGGGVVLDQTNVRNLKNGGELVYLKVDIGVCIDRIKNSSKRPPLTNEASLKKEMEQLLKERSEIYEKTADHIFKRQNDLEIDAEKIIELVG